MADELWGKRLKQARKFRRMTQGVLAEQFGTSQTQLSRMEGGEPLTEALKEWVLSVEEESRESGGLRLDGTRSNLYSYSAALARRLSEESSMRLRHLEANAEIRASKVSGFADAKLQIYFRGLRVPRGEAFYLDCLGAFPPLSPAKGMGGHVLQFDQREGSKLTLEWDKPKRATIREVTKVQTVIGPHALGYEISNADEDDNISVTIHAERGVRTDEIDAIGVPVYADCPVEAVSLRVAFIDLVPKTPPKAEVYLLRRTIVESRPVDLAGFLDHQIINESHNHYAFDKLLYPRMGFGYCIAWSTLVKAPAPKTVKK